MSDFFKKTFPTYTSNSFKNLSKTCNRNILSQPPSTKTYLAYPSNEAKDFFIQYALKKNSSLFGIRFITVQQIIHLVLKCCYKKDLPFPSHYELMFFLEEKIAELLTSDSEVAKPLKDYIGESSKRAISLASNLSHVFLDYMLYGKDALPPWLEENGWQQLLFKKVIEKWILISDAIRGCPHPPFPIALHIFGVDEIPTLYLEFFEKLHGTIHITFYAFSPSPLFWGDLISRKKSAYLDKLFKRSETNLEKRLEFANFSKETHPLLSHFCEAGKPLYNYLQEMTPTEEYEDIKMCSDLTYIQKAILYQIEPSPPPFEDNTFSIHSAPSIFRETEIVVTNILSALKEHTDLHPSDITVLAPDIDLYYPFIAYHFSQKDLPFSYTISNLQKTRHSDCLASLQLLFSLIDSRFEKDAILKLFSSPFFQRRCQISNEDKETLEKIIHYTGIRWGFDARAKDSILEKEETCSFGLFEKGFHLILDLLAQKDSTIEFSRAESIGDVMYLVEELYKETLVFTGGNYSLKEWLEKTIHFASRFLYTDEEGEFFFKEIKKITLLAKSSTYLYSFESFKRLLSEVFNKKGAWEKTYELPPITFSSMESSPPVNKALFFLGLDAENFPKKDTIRSLNELAASPLYEKKSTPAKKARYYLLKAICSARTLVSFSYTANNPVDGRARSCSPLLEEMIHALKLQEPVKHPFLSYAPTYFTKPHSLERDYHLYLASKERVTPPFSYTRPAPQPSPQKSVNYKELALLTKSPSAFFYNFATGLYENTHFSPTLFDDSEFVLSYLDRAIITKKESVEDSPSFDELVRTNKLPTAIFEEAAKQELQTAIKKEKKLLTQIFSTTNPYFSYQLSPHITSPFTKDTTTFLPAVTFTTKTTAYTIEGVLPNLTEKGIVSFKKKTPAEIWKNFPLLVLLAHLNTPTPCAIYFINEGDVRSFDRETLKPLLGPLLSYYEKALTDISPFVPEAVEEYLAQDSLAFVALKKKLLSRFSDPYLEKGAPKEYNHFEEEMQKLTKILREEDENL